MSAFTRRNALLLSTTLLASCLGASAFAQDAAPQTDNTDVSNGEIKTIIIKAERSRAAASSATKASVDATQPQSIISRPYIDLVVPETGDFTNVANIAPSVSGNSGNGAGYSDTKLVMRGFQDGEYNVTYDGIPYGDTNDPTHHSNTFFPASTIGAVIVDRGPGEAGDLGQENFGGAIHMFSNKVSDDFGFTQKVSLGSFNSWQTVSILQSGRLDQAGGLKILLNIQERSTDGALSYFSLKSSNQSVKAELPLGDHWTLSGLFTHNMNYSHQPDNDGITPTQLALYGKNFYMNNDPNSIDYYKYNNILKHTDFAYARLNGDLGNGLTVEDTFYTYFYSNKTISTLDATGGTGIGLPTTVTLAPDGVTHVKGVIKAAGALATDIPGYDKLNHYDVSGNIFRLNKAWSFGTLKVGGLMETSDTNRHRYDLVLNYQGIPGNFVRDPREKACTGPVPAVSGSPLGACPVDDKSTQLEEFSYWWQYQLFADFVWKPSDNLTITPGLKSVNFVRGVSGKIKAKPLAYVTNPPAKEKYSKTLPFLTVNYKLQPNWSLYGQYAQGFVMAPLSALYVNDPVHSTAAPQTTVNYQAGTVFNGGHFSADADVYRIDVNNKFTCDVNTCFNLGKVRYQGIEGQVAYAFDFGLTTFANASINDAKDNNPGTATYKKTIAKAPKGTMAIGGIYRSGNLKMALTLKQVGEQWADAAESAAYKIKAYDNADFAVSYDFGRFGVKLGIDNVFDHRDTTKIAINGPILDQGTPPSASSYNSDQYFFQSPRNVMLTLSGKF